MHRSKTNDFEIEPDVHDLSYSLLPTVTEPAEMDVLCGRDRNYNKQPGNQIYRQLVEHYSPIYVTITSKHEKMNLTRLILSTMQNRYNSRFVRRCTNKNGWEVLTNMQARDKISHALRCCDKQSKKISPTDTCVEHTIDNINTSDNDNWIHQSNRNYFNNVGDNNNNDDDDNNNTIVSTSVRMDRGNEISSAVATIPAPASFAHTNIRYRNLGNDSMSSTTPNSNLTNPYVDIMQERNCEEMFNDTTSFLHHDLDIFDDNLTIDSTLIDLFNSPQPSTTTSTTVNTRSNAHYKMFDTSITNSPKQSKKKIANASSNDEGCNNRKKHLMTKSKTG